MLMPAVFTVCAAILSTVPTSDTDTTAWSKSFTPPVPLKTDRLRLEPLDPEHAQLDHAALMSSREHLRKTLHWGDWPTADMTVAANRADLERHKAEFDRREAYAYTVLSLDGTRCVGCVYLKPLGQSKPRAAMVAYWVVADELPNDLDHHLVEALLEWLGKEWPLDNVVLPLHTDNARGVLLARKLKLRSAGPPRDDHVRFVWQRDKP